ncbi:MAG TPA: heme-binding protein [Stellaceae bacterium]|nr:heme-binding protein [Stellaceae bacterium]
MRKDSFGLVAALACLAGLSGGALAQQPAAPAPVPEQMPFDIPYGAPIGLDHAKRVAAAAAAEARKHNWKLNIAVVGPAGELIYFEKMDGAQNASIPIAQHKARAAATFRRETKVFQDAVDGGHPYLLSLDGIIASEGGFPLVQAGKLIGAIGCSGGTGGQDGVSCKAGAELVK